jgi:sterol desaturase/sphingolipid hydroxylase (fatty acid hydroxylase superfamily)
VNPAGAALAFLILFAAFGILETLVPERPAKRFRRGFGVDTFWFFADALVRIASFGVAIIAVVVVARRLPHGLLPAAAQQPAWLQVGEALVIIDVTGYWVHRLFHRRPLWRLHAVHHSIEDLDWLSSARVHPLEPIITRPLTLLPVVLLGLTSVHVLPVVALLLNVMPILAHANVRWDFGPLRYVIASPAFHRWHHTAEASGMDKNFAGLFPAIDLAFGTFHMPRRVSSAYGLGFGQTIPLNILAQVAYPFRSSSRT